MAVCAMLLSSPGAASGGEMLPGLKQSLRMADSAVSEFADARVSRLIAVYQPEDRAISPFLKPGRFVSRWEGFLNLQINDYYVFSARGTGRLEVRINGKTVIEQEGPDLNAVRSDEIDLRKGANRIEVTYGSPASGAAEFRLYWWNPLQPEEPLSPELFTHDAGDPDLIAGLTRRQGRRLFADLRCVKCHVPERDFPENAMPELSADSPDLTALGSRLNRDWVIQWLLDPHALRTDARMPRVLSGTPDQQHRDAMDIAAFFDSGVGQGEEHGAPGVIDEGAGLFNTLGCFTCHRLAGDALWENDERLDLKGVGRKWKRNGLTAFLQRPNQHFGWIRMPDFGLSPGEAASLAAFVLSRSEPTSVRSDAKPGDPDRGGQLVRTKGCLNCHGLDGTTDRSPAPGLAALAGSNAGSGCLSGDASGGGVRYDLDAEQRAALAVFLRRDLDSLKKGSDTEFAARQVQNLRCVACHTVDARMDLWSMSIARETATAAKTDVTGEDDLIDDFGDDAEEAAGDSAGTETNIHEVRPPLTWVGEKLHVDWMDRFMGGKLSYKPRAQLRARMPSFPAYASGLARGFALDHGFGLARAEQPAVDLERARIGQELIRVDRLGCASCHAVGGQGALSGAASEAINFQYTTDRMRRHYFDRFVLNPKRVLPGTMMPQFVDEDGRTPYPEVFGGNAHRQFEAIWEFMRTLDQ
jgi:mono/diheme cytochrome c family protein